MYMFCKQGFYRFIFSSVRNIIQNRGNRNVVLRSIELSFVTHSGAQLIWQGCWIKPDPAVIALLLLLSPGRKANSTGTKVPSTIETTKQLYGNVPCHCYRNLRHTVLPNRVARTYRKICNDFSHTIFIDDMLLNACEIHTIFRIGWLLIVMFSILVITYWIWKSETRKHLSDNLWFLTKLLCRIQNYHKSFIPGLCIRPDLRVIWEIGKPGMVCEKKVHMGITVWCPQTFAI